MRLSYRAKDRLRVVALVAGGLAVLAFGLWFQFGGAGRRTFVVAAKQYKVVAADGQNWQITTTDGRRFYTNAAEYARMRAGRRVSCMIHGRSWSLPLAPDHLASANLCRSV